MVMTIMIVDDDEEMTMVTMAMVMGDGDDGGDTGGGIVVVGTGGGGGGGGDNLVRTKPARARDRSRLAETLCSREAERELGSREPGPVPRAGGAKKPGKTRYSDHN
jgi:hypothetical protein